MADWSELPWPALNRISKFLPFAVDYIRFRSVCTSWRSSAPKRHHLPLLVNHHVDNKGLLTIFNLSTFTGSEFIPIPNDELPESPLNGLCCGSSHGWLAETTLNGLCCGSSHGWLAFLDPTPGITLWNPITKSHIKLPDLTDYPDINEGKITHRRVEKMGDYYVLRFEGDGYRGSSIRTFGQMQKYLASKLILSSDPSTDPNCVALLLRCRWRRMAVCRMGDDAWTPVKFREFRNFNTDAVFYKGKFYIVCRQALYVLNLGLEPVLERVPMTNPPFDEDPTLPETDECYLVESSGDLLLVNAYYSEPNIEHYKFEVYKVDWGMHRIKLLKLRDLPDRLLFLGRNQSVSLPASKFPECKANIYRVCNFEDGNNSFIYNCSAGIASNWRPCAWFMPSLL